MNQSEQYHFNDFTSENYGKLIRLAKKNYVFRNFHNFNENEKFVIWRHDIDISLHRSLALAKIEAEEKVQATYFVLLHSEFYNLLEKENTDLLIDIRNLGHEIGLHFDAHYYNIQNESDLEFYLRFEKEFLEKLFQIEVKSFSFHITNAFTMSCQKEKYADMLNVYASYFQDEVGYCSDSNGYWRFRRLEDVLSQAQDTRLQVLTHPSLWQDVAMSPRQRVLRCVEGRAKKTMQWHHQTLQKYGREDIPE